MERKKYPQHSRLKMNSPHLKSLGKKKLLELKEFIVARLRKELPAYLPEYCKKDGPIFESWVDKLSSSISDYLGDAGVNTGGYDRRRENFKHMYETRERISNLPITEDKLCLRLYLGSPEFMSPILKKLQELKS